MTQLKPLPGGYYVWDYVPSIPAAAIFVALFFAATSYILWRMIKTRTWFSTAFVIGGVFEMLGYIGRAISHDRTDQLGSYIMQSVLILVAPALFAASIYMTLGRVIRSIHGERHSIIPVRRLTLAFVLGDVASFMVQSAGGGLMGSKNFDPKVGERIILGGLFVQIIMFGLFAVTAVIFHVRMVRWPSAASTDPASKWKLAMTMLYATSVLIMVRSIFRVVEYIMGRSGYLLRHEWTLYVFDATLMFITMVVYAWQFPGDLVAVEAKPRPWDSMDSRDDGVTDEDVRLGSRADSRVPIHGGVNNMDR